MTRKYVIIGGGAAGFFAAVNLAQKKPQSQIILLEKTGKLLSKVKVSGGGRCNVTHDCEDVNQLVKRYPRGEKFLKRVFHRFPVSCTVQWFAAQGVRLKTEADGRMFPDTNSSQQVIDCLLGLATRFRIQVRMNAEVVHISQGEDARFTVKLRDGLILQADSVCICAGGSTKMEFYQYLMELGHRIIPPVPSLFTFNLPGHDIRNLQGVSVPAVTVKIAGSRLKETGPLLITHWGLSGPVVLRLSAWGAHLCAEKQWQFKIVINWLPDYNEASLREYVHELRKEKAAQLLQHKNPFGLPARLWLYLLSQCGIEETVKWGTLPSKEQNKLIATLAMQEMEVKGKTTFKEEFVTAGGVALPEIDTATMMSRKIPGLYFAGEIIDVDGITGGFNFQNAWATAYIAACSMAEEM